MKFSPALKALVVGVALATSSAAMAITSSFVVDAKANSTSGGGTGVNTFSLVAGQQFSVTVDENDLWNAGALPRWSNANGLNTNLYYANGMDPEVSVSSGTQIGSVFGNWTQGGLTDAYGSLVGQIGSGSFFKIGTSFTGTASASGFLKLFYFDSNLADNSGSITAQVTAVPEPETYAMLLAGLGLMAGIARSRKNK